MPMMDNKLKTMVTRGQHPTVVFVSSGSTWTAHSVSQMDFDSVLIDLQLGPAGIDRLFDLVMAVGHQNCPLVRVPSIERGLIEKAVEVGVHGVVCPSIDTAEEAAVLVEACRHSRVTECLPIAQIESVSGYENLEEICATPGLFALLPGPKDLSIAFGGPPRIDFTDENAVARLQRIIDVAHKYGLYVTVPALDRTQLQMVLDWGSDYVTVPGFDLSWITAGAQNSLAVVRDVLAERSSGRTE